MKRVAFCNSTFSIVASLLGTACKVNLGGVGLGDGVLCPGLDGLVVEVANVYRVARR